MIYSANNESINDELLPKHATCVTAANTSHLNYHDIAGLLPPLRWIRAVGSAEPVSVLQWRNRTIAEFIRDPHPDLLARAPIAAMLEAQKASATRE